MGPRESRNNMKHIVGLGWAGVVLAVWTVAVAAQEAPLRLEAEPSAVAAAASALTSTEAPEKKAEPAPGAPPAQEAAPVESKAAEPSAPAAQPPPEEPMTEAQAKALPFVKEGEYYARVGNHNLAVESFLKALKEDPQNFAASFGLGTSYIAREEYGEAVKMLNWAIETHPKNYFAKNNLAWLYATAKDPAFRDGAKAVRLAQEALLSGPRDFHVWSTLSEAYYMSGNYDKSFRAAEQALALATEAKIDSARLQSYISQYNRGRDTIQALDILEP